MKDLYSEGIDKVGKCLDELGKDEQKFKQSWGQKAKRNVAFANGDHRFDSDAVSLWVDNKPVDYARYNRQNVYIGNEIEPIIRTLVSYMTRRKPAVEVFSVGRDKESKNVAAVAQGVNEAKYHIDKEYKNSRMSAYWGLTLGTCFGKDYWDSTKGGYYEGEKAGGNNVAILTPFSTMLDHENLDYDEQLYIGDSYMKDVEWAREAYNRDGEGYTGKAASIQEDNKTTDTLNMLEDLKYALPMGGTQRSKTKNKCMVEEWYIRPNRDFTHGRLLVKAGGVWVFDGPSPYFLESEFGDDEMWHPYSPFTFEMYVGRLLGKSLVEQLVPLQLRLNEINGSILENANTLAKPNIMAMEGQLRKGVMSGTGAKIYTYANIPGSTPPFVLQGAQLPSQFFNERQAIIDQMVRIAGTNFVMQGQPPSGVTAAAAIDMLLENANNQQSDMMMEWAQYHESRFTKKLRSLHKFQKTVDLKLQKYARAFNKDSSEQAIDNFVGQDDLTDEIIVKIEVASMIPKSETAKRNTYKELGKEGLLGPIQDPGPEGAKLRNQMLERIGEKAFETEETTEVAKAKWENERIRNGKAEETPVGEFDNDVLHTSIHVSSFQDPKFIEETEEEIKQGMYRHIKGHEEKTAKKAEAEQQQAMEAQRQAEAEKEAKAQQKAMETQARKEGSAVPPPGAQPIQ